MHISLGCNCHPAYWLRKLGLRKASFPFDWVLARPNHLLSCVNDLIDTNFDNWLSDLSLNNKGNVIDTTYPNVSLFHHSNLVSQDQIKKVEERTKLNRRATRFKNTIKAQNNNFYFFYPLTYHQLHDEFCENIILFSKKVKGSLLIYYTSDYLDNGKLSVQNDVEKFYSCVNKFPSTKLNTRLIHHRRDLRNSKIWGQEPDFLREKFIVEASMDWFERDLWPNLKDIPSKSL